MNNFSHVAHFSATFSLIWLQQVRSAAARQLKLLFAKWYQFLWKTTTTTKKTIN